MYVSYSRTCCRLQEVETLAKTTLARPTTDPIYRPVLNNSHGMWCTHGDHVTWSVVPARCMPVGQLIANRSLGDEMN